MDEYKTTIVVRGSTINAVKQVMRLARKIFFAVLIIQVLMWRNSSIVVCVAIGTVKITPMNYIVTIRIRARFAVINLL